MRQVDLIKAIATKLQAIPGTVVSGWHQSPAPVGSPVPYGLINVSEPTRERTSGTTYLQTQVLTLHVKAGPSGGLAGVIETELDSLDLSTLTLPLGVVLIGVWANGSRVSKSGETYRGDDILDVRATFTIIVQVD